MNKKRFVLIIFVFLLNFHSNAQDIFSGFEHLFTPPRNYIVYKINSEIQIDGLANEPEWANANWTEDFVDIEGSLKPLPHFQTRAKMLWDDESLYIYAELEEPHVWAYFNVHDLIVFNENDFEVFIDPDNDTRNYFEIEINAQNTIFDLLMPKAYRNGGPALITWNAPELKSATFVNGTINNPEDTDRKWTVEMAIPFETLKLGVNKKVPENGDEWRINFSRVQWQTEIVDGKYVRKTDAATKKNLPENNWVWSPIGIINMHYPERWGTLQFATAKELNGSLQPDKSNELRNYLWLIYYKQKKFLSENGSYATSLHQLSVPDSLKTESGENLKIELFASEFQFLARLTSMENKIFTIDHEGFIRIIN